jgi:Porphobilinogen deaminase, dipyromethane cofactor binding domain
MVNPCRDAGRCGRWPETRILANVNTYTIRIGSRGSQLALWQANHVAAQLRSQGHTVEIEVIRTLGDRM